MTNKISVFTESIAMPYQGVSKKAIQQITEKAVSLAGLKKVALSIILTSNDYIREINRNYRKKDYATDVITFANRDEAFPDVGELTEDLGDIFISIEKALEQSSEFGVSFLDEVKRLLVHGILHCLGYDHESSPNNAVIMNTKEDEILKKL